MNRRLMFLLATIGTILNETIFAALRNDTAIVENNLKKITDHSLEGMELLDGDGNVTEPLQFSNDTQPRELATNNKLSNKKLRKNKPDWGTMPPKNPVPANQTFPLEPGVSKAVPINQWLMVKSKQPGAQVTLKFESKGREFTFQVKFPDKKQKTKGEAYVVLNDGSTINLNKSPDYNTYKNLIKDKGSYPLSFFKSFSRGLPFYSSKNGETVLLMSVIGTFMSGSDNTVISFGYPTRQEKYGPKIGDISQDPNPSDLIIDWPNLPVECSSSSTFLTNPNGVTFGPYPSREITESLNNNRLNGKFATFEMSVDSKVEVALLNMTSIRRLEDEVVKKSGKNLKT